MKKKQKRFSSSTDMLIRTWQFIEIRESVKDYEDKHLTAWGPDQPNHGSFESEQMPTEQRNVET